MLFQGGFSENKRVLSPTCTPLHPNKGFSRLTRFVVVATLLVAHSQDSCAFLYHSTNGLSSRKAFFSETRIIHRRCIQRFPSNEVIVMPRMTLKRDSQALEGSKRVDQISRRHAMGHVLLGSAWFIASATPLPAQAGLNSVLMKGLDSIPDIANQVYNQTVKMGALDKESEELLDKELRDRIDALEQIRLDISTGNFTCTRKPKEFVAESFEACLEKNKNKPYGIEWAGPLVLIASGIATASFVEYERFKRRASNRMVSSSFRELMSYYLENALSNTFWAKPMLFVTTLTAVITIGAVLLLLDPFATKGPQTFQDAVVESWLLFTGTKVRLQGPVQQVAAVLVSAAGLMGNAALIAIFAEFVSEKVEMLKKGREGVKVVEAGHTIVLGWSTRSVEVIRQVALANVQFGGGSIIILENKLSKADVEDLITQGFGKSVGTKIRNYLGSDIVVRNADPLLPSELEKISIDDARSIICLADARHTSKESDAHMLRQLLAIKASAPDFDRHVVIETSDQMGADAVMYAAPKLSVPIMAHRLLGSLLVKCALRPSLGFVVCQLASFEGAEPYLRRFDELVGLTFNDIWYRFDNGIPVGLLRGADGRIFVNPPGSLVVGQDDEIILISEDGVNLIPNSREAPDPHGGIPKNSIPIPPPKFERALVCGWRQNVGELFQELDMNMFQGSEIWWLDMAEISKRGQYWGNCGGLKNAKMRHAVGDPRLRSSISPVTEFTTGDRMPNKVNLEEFSVVLTLQEGGDALSVQLSIQEAIQERPSMRVRVSGGQIYPTEVVAEINDVTTQGLLKALPGNSENVNIMPRVSSAVCALFAQVSLRKDMGGVYEALSARLRLRDCCQYTTQNEELSFWEMAARVRQTGKVLVGYKLPGDGWETKAAAETCLNPPNKEVKRRWVAGTTIVIVQSSLEADTRDQ